ncbi:class I SAM-dependent RNA methyltransferase [Pseudonocardia benzenivorans]|uniref:Class I SAM-dependent RNA methyltransferase n=1 Tax=Pseudonocardia benzenivorans TaxID=228005 RepID=A0ABW3VI83_9PSEU
MSGRAAPRVGAGDRSGTTDWTDRVLDLEIGAVAHGGHCVARHDGRVVFVRHALPGERVLAVVTEDGGGSFCRADAISVRTAHAGRVAPPCTWARAGGCGGCDFQHATPELQRELKTVVVREQLARLAGIDSDVTVEELPGGPLGWRTRVRLAVDGEGRAGLRAHRSHEVLPVADCPIAPEGVLPPVLARRHRPGEEFEITVDADGTVHDERDGAPVVQRVAGREWRLRPGAFWQVHPALAPTLAAVVGQWAAAPAGATAWDLYGGAGLFAAVLAEQVGRDGAVTVVESAAGAVADGEAALADLPQVAWEVGRVERVLPALADPDVVVADPPRSGLGRALVEAICARGPRRVVHVACDPAALGRDVGLFAAQGYRLTALRAFDAFPMTHHMECVALLEP